MKKILFVDCETNGLPIDYKASYTEVDNWPRVISLAWILTDENANVVAQSHSLIKPDGWDMPTEAFWVDNGFSQEKSLAEGLPIVQVLEELKAAKEQADVLVAHNLSFDHRIIWAEFIRNGMEPRTGMHKICTMMKSTNVCKIPAKRGYKWPKLEELYRFLFRKEMENAHDALADVTACMECFFALLGQGVVSLEIPQEKLM